MPAGAVARVPPLVVHGFRNASGEELRYLNFHAPGVGFADYLRAMRDGRAMTYDQEPPPADGVRPATEAVIGEPGTRVHVDIDAIRIEELRREPGDHAPQPHDRLQSYYVLDGELELRAGDRETVAATGTWVQVPPGVPHALGFPGAVRYLDVRA